MNEIKICLLFLKVGDIIHNRDFDLLIQLARVDPLLQLHPKVVSFLARNFDLYEVRFAFAEFVYY